MTGLRAFSLRRRLAYRIITGRRPVSRSDEDAVQLIEVEFVCGVLPFVGGKQKGKR